jgi:hypothetical protein
MRKTPPKTALFGITLSVFALAWGGIASSSADRSVTEAEQKELAEVQSARVVAPVHVQPAIPDPGNC